MYTFDYTNSLIAITGTHLVDCQDLYNNITQEEASSRGICFKNIANASGKESLSNSVYVGITINLLDLWKLSFTPGSYTAIISGGNLVSETGDPPVNYSSGVQVILLQSAASTIASGGGSSDISAIADAVWSYLVDGLVSSKESMAIQNAILAGKVSGAGTGVEIFRDLADTKDRVISTVDSAGNRTSEILDGT
jgi:hypothetical protein